jgi:SAM-dependent methyltransferase
MSTAESTHYPLERREGEIERLRIQAEAMAHESAAMLDRIGVGPGWHCLDLGCGPSGITRPMSERVGASGRVIGLDADPIFIDHARRHTPPNVEFVLGNAYESNLPNGSFDLVHLRFVASTAGRPEVLLREAIRLTRLSGVVALQEPDMSTLNCYPPHPAWERLKAALIGAFASAGADINLAQRLFGLARAAGLTDVQYRPFLFGVRSGDAWIDYLPATVESLRGTIIKEGLLKPGELDSAIAECRGHLARPDTVFTSFTVAQVWGHTAANTKVD